MFTSSNCVCSRSFLSSAPSGSSSSSSFGRLTSERASATRCRWPPESWCGLRLANSRQLHDAEHLGDARRDLRARQAFLLAGRSATFCSTVMCGNSAYDWNIMLTGRSYGGTPVMSCPSMKMRPRSASRSPRACAAASSCRSPSRRAGRRSRPVDLQRDVVDRDEVAELLGDAVDADVGHGVADRSRARACSQAGRCLPWQRSEVPDTCNSWHSGDTPPGECQELQYPVPACATVRSGNASTSGSSVACIPPFRPDPGTAWPSLPAADTRPDRSARLRPTIAVAAALPFA